MTCNGRIATLHLGVGPLEVGVIPPISAEGSTIRRIGSLFRGLRFGGRLSYNFVT